jgi:molybdopterin synthase sulfur carrier subunit
MPNVADVQQEERAKLDLTKITTCYIGKRRKVAGAMLVLTIKFFAALRDITGKREQSIELGRAEATIGEVLDELSREYGKNFKEYVYEAKSKAIRSQISIMVNGQSLRNPESLSARVKDGDIIAILPPISGG